MPKSEKYKATMSEIRAKIADAKRRGTKQGFIGYYGCIDICNTFMEILDEAEKFVCNERSENDEAKINLVHELLVDRHEAKYYGMYKELLQRFGRWEQESSALMNELEYSVFYESFADILWKENKEFRLLEHMKKYPSIALYYTEKLGTKYSDVTYPLCIAEIENYAEQASNRKQYKKVCSEIKRLSHCGVDVMPLIEKLKENYPRRSAFVDELEKLSAKI